MAEWISVKDRLPEKNGSYLCYGGLDMHICHFAQKLSDVDKSDFYGKDRCGFYEYDREYGCLEWIGITHWMPLPEAPKGG